MLPITSHENERRVAALGGSTRLESFPLLHVDFYRDDPNAQKWPEWLVSQGLRRTSHAFQVRFRAETLQRPQLRRFRQWLLDEGSLTRRWLEPYAGERAAE